MVVGIDSCTNDGQHRFVTAEKRPLTFDVDGHPQLVAGIAGLHLMIDELAAAWRPPCPDSDDPVAFFRSCARSLRDHFTAEPLWDMARDRDEGGLDGHFLLAWRGTACEVGSRFDVLRPSSGEVTIGSSRPILLGALVATRGRPAEERVAVALAAAAEYDQNVTAPFTIVRVAG